MLQNWIFVVCRTDWLIFRFFFALKVGCIWKCDCDREDKEKVWGHSRVCGNWPYLSGVEIQEGHQTKHILKKGVVLLLLLCKDSMLERRKNFLFRNLNFRHSGARAYLVFARIVSIRVACLCPKFVEFVFSVQATCQFQSSPITLINSQLVMGQIKQTGQHCLLIEAGKKCQYL